jgi:hypothetical protein
VVCCSLRFIHYLCCDIKFSQYDICIFCLFCGLPVPEFFLSSLLESPRVPLFLIKFTVFVTVCSLSLFSQFSPPLLFRCQLHSRVRLRRVSYTAVFGSALEVTQCRFACPQCQVTLCSSAEYVNTLQNPSLWCDVSHTVESDTALSINNARQSFNKHSLCWLTLQCHSYIHNFLRV